MLHVEGESGIVCFQVIDIAFDLKIGRVFTLNWRWLLKGDVLMMGKIGDVSCGHTL